MVYHSNSPWPLWKTYLFRKLADVRLRTLELHETYSLPPVVRMPSFNVHFHLFLTR